ncbi:MAG TPA: chemotaxis protein CheW [Candidatus Dormibacteraeota bacterium]
MIASISRDSQQVLLERARRLAMPLGDGADARVTMLAFTLGDEGFVTALAGLTEATPVSHLAPLRNVPALYAGIANVRGALIPVFDLRSVLNIHAPRADTLPIMLVIDTPQPAGIWVDRLDGLLSVERATLRRDHGPQSAWFLGRTPDLRTAIDLRALLAAAIALQTNRPQEASTRP